MTDIVDGYLDIGGNRTYYKVVGPPNPGTVPLLVLHGGPGAAHNYLLSLSALGNERQVIFYDQVGCGLSDKPEDASLWTVQTFIDELAEVRKQLGLTSVHILGHSWGGMLAIDYLLTEPTGVRSVILASTMISIPLYQEEVEKLKRDLPREVYQTLTEHEQAGTTGDEAYWQQFAVFDKTHIFRGDVYPMEYRTPKGGFGAAVYHSMWGASEAYADGSLKTWDRIDQLGRVNVPTLITSGQYDELTPRQALLTHRRIPGSQIAILTAASHCAHHEHEAEYAELVSDFLNSVEAGH
jgi:proline-specific peptidase